MDYAQYRTFSQYDGLFQYVAPTGYHWVCGNDDFGKVVWGKYDLSNKYELVKD